jgi:hypothetical protein
MPSSTRARRPPHATNRLRASVENVRVHVPRVDWARVRIFEKRMWRTYSLRRVELTVPRPVLLYSEHPQTGQIDTVVACLTDTWQEPLAAISDEDLAEEGFASRGEFKRYFAERYPQGGFRPLVLVQVYRVRPLTEADRQEWMSSVWQRLYGGAVAA